MFNWYAALDSVNKRIAELETRISVLRAELQRADGQVAKTIAQRILLIRERELERAKGPDGVHRTQNRDGTT